ncbi:hypothetical protein SDC9_129262 [bioreactor metagenome]|uniref:Uncharacterized protein n=1 Tax=bioreactor metagenome TaxID=1076179 RepID=A0A645CZ85_9ZZZZ
MDIPYRNHSTKGQQILIIYIHRRVIHIAPAVHIHNLVIHLLAINPARITYGGIALDWYELVSKAAKFQVIPDPNSKVSPHRHKIDRTVPFVIGYKVQDHHLCLGEYIFV